MSVLKVIPEAIPGQKCYVNMDPVLIGYGDMGI
jgi:hypothetical protein